VGEELSYQNGNGAACLSKVSSTHKPDPFNPSKREGSVYCNLFFNFTKKSHFNSIPAMNQKFDALTLFAQSINTKVERLDTTKDAKVCVSLGVEQVLVMG
jgi:hypothetical protein